MSIRDRRARPGKMAMLKRLIGSIRRECTDHSIDFDAKHLRRIFAKYATYCNEVRTHVSLGKDEPCTRPTSSLETCRISDPWRAPPSIRSNLIFRSDTHYG